MEQLFEWLTENLYWIIPSVFSGIVALSTLWRWVIKPRRQTRERRKRVLLTKLGKEKSAFLWLREAIDERWQMLVDQYYFEAKNMLIAFPNDLQLPHSWKSELQDTYNRGIEELSYLLFGGRNFVRNVVSRNVQKHFAEINLCDDGKWILGHHRAITLDLAMADALEEPIMLGHRVDKPLIESIDDEIYDQMRNAMKQKQAGKFKAFFRDVNEELENDRENGILRFIEVKRKELEKFIDSLRMRIEARIEDIARKMEEDERQNSTLAHTST